MNEKTGGIETARARHLAASTNGRTAFAGREAGQREHAVARIKLAVGAWRAIRDGGGSR
jgi:hypothetical protein